MTLTSQVVKATHSGDSVQPQFTVTFIFFDPDDFMVVLTDTSGVETTLVRGTNYSVSGGSGATGTITFITTVPAIGETLTILSSIPTTQPLDLPAGGALPSTGLEQQLDKIVRMIQETAEEFDRALKFSTASSTTGIVVPEPVANNVLRWNAAADALENATAASGALTLPLGVSDGGTGAITVALARVALSLPTSAQQARTETATNLALYTHGSL